MGVDTNQTISQDTSLPGLYVPYQGERPCIDSSSHAFLGCPGDCGLACWFPLSRRPATPRLAPDGWQELPAEALAWLAEVLSDGRKYALDMLLQEGAARGYSREALYLAAFFLGVQTGAYAGGHYWQRKKR